MPDRPDPLQLGAVFSPCRTWRYLLLRTWDDDRPRLNVIGINPSTADEARDDPTIRRCIGFARRWAFGGLVVTNLFAFRATEPGRLRAVADPVGPENDAYLLEAGRGAGLVLAAWGVHGAYRDRARRVLEQLTKAGVELVCLGRTRDGHPRHPLYVRADQPPGQYAP